MSRKGKRELEGVAVAEEHAGEREKAGPASYSDGHPPIKYLESPLILKPDRFTSVE